MKKKVLGTGIAALAMVFALLFTGCSLLNTDGDKGKDNEKKEEPTTDTDFVGFYNYPTGRVDINGGRLTIENKLNSDVLLFTGTVDPVNYIGTVGPLERVKVKLAEEKFQTITAVEKALYKERKEQAAQFSVLTYYSNLQTYTVSVNPSSIFGGGRWVFNNNTNYWVEVKKSDLSQNFAVIAPNATQVVVPVQIGENYTYSLNFRRELKYDNKVIALVDFTDRSQNDTAVFTAADPTFRTNITNANVPNSAQVKPAVMVINNSTKSVQVLYGNSFKSNGAASGDFWIASGRRALVSGFEQSDNTGAIGFSSTAWAQDMKVPVDLDMVMTNNKIYEIKLPSSDKASEITVEEVDSSKYYN